MIGQIIGYRYEVQTELSSDGLFTIYRGLDAQRGRLVKLRAVNPILGRESEFLNELERICEKHFRFQHPGLEKVLDLYHEGPDFVIVCDYDDGALLEERLKRLNSFQAPAALSVCISIAEALESCHSQGVIHGDVSCVNVFSKRSDGVTLMCAGYWEAYGISPYAARTVHLSMAPYLAPEVTAGGMPSPSSDIYSLGVLVFRLLSGRYPYSAESPTALAHLHATALPPSLRRTNTSIPVSLDHVIHKCLAKNPQDRYSSASLLLRDLRMIQDSQRFGRPVRGIAAPAPSSSEPAQEPTVVRVDTKAIAAEKEEAQAGPKAASGADMGKPDGLPLWAMIIAWMGLLVFIFTGAWWVSFTFARPDDKTVPDVVGQSEQEAMKKLLDLGLQMHRFEKASSKPKGQVLELNPGPGRVVKANFPVKVIVSAGSPFVETPDLRGRSLDEARQLLATLGLDLSKDIQVDYDPDLKPNVIMRQEPGSKERLQRLSRVRVTVNSGAPLGDNADQPEPKWHSYRLRIPLPDPAPESTDDLQVKIDMSDRSGTTTLHEGAHRPGEVLSVRVNGEGPEVVFRVYINGELWDRVSKSPPNPAGGQ